MKPTIAVTFGVYVIFVVVVMASIIASSISLTPWVGIVAILFAVFTIVGFPEVPRSANLRTALPFAIGGIIGFLAAIAW